MAVNLPFCPCNTASSGFGQSGGRQPHPQCATLTPPWLWFWKYPVSKELCLCCVVWGLPKGTGTRWSPLLPLIRSSPGLQNGGHSLKIMWGESNKSQPPGKRFQWRHKRVLRAWEEKLRKAFLWEIRPFKSTYVYWRTESAKRGPGQDACSEKSWEHHLWLTSMPTSNRKWRLRQICKQNGQILKDCPSTELTCKDWKFFYCFSPCLSAFPFLLTPGTQGNLLSKHQLNTS